MEILNGFRGCPVCHLYGNIPRSFPVLPTRLLTRDAFLSGESRDTLFKKSTELPFTEVKTETLVDRISSASTPRYRERIPAGTVFDASWSLSCYSTGGEDRNDHLLLALFFAGWSLLEGDYLGGQGTRGYGGVSFEEVHVDIGHNRGLSKDATDLVEQLKESRTTEELLSTTGNPLSSVS
jgi:CRISPR-associated protein Csm3